MNAAEWNEKSKRERTANLGQQPATAPAKGEHWRRYHSDGVMVTQVSNLGNLRQCTVDDFNEDRGKFTYLTDSELGKELAEQVFPLEKERLWKD